MVPTKGEADPVKANSAVSPPAKAITKIAQLWHFGVLLDTLEVTQDVELVCQEDWDGKLQGVSKNDNSLVTKINSLDN